MTCSAHRFREFTIHPDVEPDAEPWSYAMQCAVCDESSPAGEDVIDTQQWAAEHLKDNPEHYTYREHVSRPYRFEPGQWL